MSFGERLRNYEMGRGYSKLCLPISLLVWGEFKLWFWELTCVCLWFYSFILFLLRGKSQLHIQFYIFREDIKKKKTPKTLKCNFFVFGVRGRWCTSILICVFVSYFGLLKRHVSSDVINLKKVKEYTK